MKRYTSGSRRSYLMAFCALGMATIAFFILVARGVTPVTAILIVALLCCPIAGFYAWRASRRAEREIDAFRSTHERP